MDGFSKKKYLIITAGATGAGKSGLINETLKELGIYHDEYAKILVDDLVENDPKYKIKVKNIITKVKTVCDMDPGCIEHAYNNPRDFAASHSVNLLQDFGDSYFAVRKSKGCGTSDSNDYSVPSCDDLNDQILKDAVATNKNVIFESTGSYIPSWLLNEEYVNPNYNIVVSYTLVSLRRLIERNKSRAIKSIQDFEKDYTKPAPRLPDISDENFSKAVLLIKTTLIDLFNSCIQNYETNKQKCGEKKIDRLLLFDNNGPKMIKIYDSVIDTDISKSSFIKMIDDQFGYISSGGTNKRRTNKRRTNKRRTNKRRTNKRRRRR